MMCIYCGVESTTSTDGVCPNCGRKNEPEQKAEETEYRKAEPQSRLLDRISDFFVGKKRG